MKHTVTILLILLTSAVWGQEDMKAVDQEKAAELMTNVTKSQVLAKYRALKDSSNLDSLQRQDTSRQQKVNDRVKIILVDKQQKLKDKLAQLTGVGTDSAYPNDTIPQDSLKNKLRDSKLSKKSMKGITEKLPKVDLPSLVGEDVDLGLPKIEEIADLQRQDTSKLQKVSARVKTTVADTQRKLKDKLAQLAGADKDSLNISDTLLNNGLKSRLSNKSIEGMSKKLTKVDVSNDNGILKKIKEELPSTEGGTGLPKVEGVEVLENVKGIIDGSASKELTEQLPEIGKPDKLPKVEGVDELKSVKEEMGNLSEVSEQVQGYSKELPEISKDKIPRSSELTSELESKVGEIDDVKELKSQTKAFDQIKKPEDYKKEGEVYMDQEALREKAKAKALKLAQDKTLKGQKQVKSAHEKIAGLKKKYDNLQTTRDLPKIKPNAMKGKPFKERFIYGGYVQVNKLPHMAIDLLPMMGYKISGTFLAGIGGTYRVDFGEDNRSISSDHLIYGGRLFLDGNVYKKYFLHAEAEFVNTEVPNPFVFAANEVERDWITGVLVGVVRRYKISHAIKGNMQALYNLNYKPGISPFARKLTLRFGVEFGGEKKRPKLSLPSAPNISLKKKKR